MASTLIGGVIQTTFAAISFAGAGFLFSKINHTGYEAEIKRHNHALEALAKSKERFYEKEIRRKDKLQQLREELSDANNDINQTNKALDLLKKINVLSDSPSEGLPTLSNFYTPSEEMQKYQAITVGVIGLGGGFLVERYLL